MVPGAVLWEATADLEPLPPAALPARVDTAVIGGGYTGLAAARALGRAGATVAVLEQGRIGGGASGRNGGFVLPGYKAGLDTIVRRHGLPRARRLFEASLAAIGFVEQLVREEAIACDWHRPGSLTVAAKPGHFAGLQAEQRVLQRDFGHPTTLLGPADLRTEIGSGHFHGGLLDPTAAAVQPAKYVHGLARAAVRAGALLCEATGVTGLARRSGIWRLATTRGPVEAGEVLLATNGYTDRLVPWLGRRIVPIGSFIIATEPLAPAVAATLLPRGRVVSDTRNLLHYFRLSPDGRMVFGGRAGFRPEALDASIRILRRDLVVLFPELAGTPLAFGWGGTLGFTLDQLPHAGRRDGLAYAVGYCGHGVALASWLGDRIAAAMSGASPWPELSTLGFAPVPLYTGRPWFLPLAGAYYQCKDWLF